MGPYLGKGCLQVKSCIRVGPECNDTSLEKKGKWTQSGRLCEGGRRDADTVFSRGATGIAPLEPPKEPTLLQSQFQTAAPQDCGSKFLLQTVQFVVIC